MASILFDMAHTAKALPWFLPRTNLNISYRNDIRATEFAMDIQNFANKDLAMNPDAHKVTFTYMFRDFQGEKVVKADREALLITRCEDIEASPHTVIPLTSSNTTLYPGWYRWIYPTPFNESRVPHNQTVQICTSTTDSTGHVHDALICLYADVAVSGLVGKSQDYKHTPTSAYPFPSQLEQSYLVNRTIVFNCSLSFTSDLIAESIYNYLRSSLVGPRWSWNYGYGENASLEVTNDTMVEIYKDFESMLEFSFGVSRKDRHESGRWLSAFIGNYIGNGLSFLNDFFGRTQAKAEDSGINSNLEVQWARVAGILGALTAFQLLFGLAALIYCRRNFEIVDDVSFMFTNFPFVSEAEGAHKRAVHDGKFVREGDGVRWVFATGSGKDITAGPRASKDIKVT